MLNRAYLTPSQKIEEELNMSYLDSAPKKENCPRCGLPNSVGDCGHNRFFCNDCSIEFKMKKDRVEIYEITEEGIAILSTILPRPKT